MGGFGGGGSFGDLWDAIVELPGWKYLGYFILVMAAIKFWYITLAFLAFLLVMVLLVALVQWIGRRGK